MPMFKSPYSSKNHHFQEYDDDYILLNSKTKEKSDTQFNLSVLRDKAWNRNVFSTRKKVYNDIVLDRDQLLARSKKYHKRLKPRKWYNW
jgi:putative lipase involved disintegration of autophagic bodies